MQACRQPEWPLLDLEVHERAGLAPAVYGEGGDRGRFGWKKQSVAESRLGVKVPVFAVVEPCCEDSRGCGIGGCTAGWGKNIEPGLCGVEFEIRGDWRWNRGIGDGGEKCVSFVRVGLKLVSDLEAIFQEGSEAEVDVSRRLGGSAAELDLSKDFRCRPCGVWRGDQFARVEPGPDGDCTGILAVP